MNQIAWLDPDLLEFPPIEQALEEPDGLLAAGGDLSPQRLILAYRSGIFPWYEEGQPILWWSPDPRAVLPPSGLKVSRSLRRRLKSGQFEIRIDTAFDQVLENCSQPRAYADGTWITAPMKAAYRSLHRLGVAHSIETFEDDVLVGGLYGIGLGQLFFGESMFHHQTDASKVAFAWLCRLMERAGCPLIDCQIENDHLESLGAVQMARRDFKGVLNRYASEAAPSIDWQILPSCIEPW